MAKKVFFSFHYKDVVEFRANVVRKHWQFQLNRQSAGYFDKSVWEKAKSQSDLGLKRLINSALVGTSTTCVLIGSQTYARPWVRYEIMKSFREGKNILGVHINSIRGKDQKTKIKGPNPLSYLGVVYSDTGRTATLKKNINGKWYDYKEIGESATFNTGGIAAKHHGKGYNFAQWYRVYDWISDDGYNNFANWIA